MADPVYKGNAWALCGCGHAWIQHDVDEYRGDGTEMCCVEGCDQLRCPGRQPKAAVNGDG